MLSVAMEAQTKMMFSKIFNIFGYFWNFELKFHYPTRTQGPTPNFSTVISLAAVNLNAKFCVGPWYLKNHLKPGKWKKIDKNHDYIWFSQISMATAGEWWKFLNMFFLYTCNLSILSKTFRKCFISDIGLFSKYGPYWP